MCPSPDPLFTAVCDTLTQAHPVHTVLLYGSRARGDADAQSDVDVVAFGPVGEALQIAQPLAGTVLDAWIYPDALLPQPPLDWLRFRGARIGVDTAGQAQPLLDRLDTLHAQGPTPWTEVQRQTQRVWAEKMLARTARGDLEGLYRRAWLLQALLEDYFGRRRRWYEGPKRALHWLQTHDPKALACLHKALQAQATFDDLQAWVQTVCADPPPT